MKTIVSLLFIVSVFMGSVSAEVVKGVGRKDVIAEWGTPNSFSRIGNQETMIYPNKVRVAVAARMYELEHGKAPKKVADLVPEFLAAMPESEVGLPKAGGRTED